jgi:hypothetical protein
MVLRGLPSASRETPLTLVSAYEPVSAPFSTIGVSLGATPSLTYKALTA